MTKPSWSARNFTPSSTAAVSESLGPVGVCVDVKMVHGQVAASAGSGGTATSKPKLRASPIRAASNLFLPRADGAATDRRIEIVPPS